MIYVWECVYIVYIIIYVCVYHYIIPTSFESQAHNSDCLLTPPSEQPRESTSSRDSLSL